MEAASKLVAVRGRLTRQLPCLGAMGSAAAGMRRVQAAIAHAGSGGVGIAALNAPESVVISGVESEVRAVLNDLESDGIRTQILPTSHAFHSPLIDPMLDALEDAARKLKHAAQRTA